MRGDPDHRFWHPLLSESFFLDWIPRGALAFVTTFSDLQLPMGDNAYVNLRTWVQDWVLELPADKLWSDQTQRSLELKDRHSCL